MAGTDIETSAAEYRSETHVLRVVHDGARVTEPGSNKGKRVISYWLGTVDGQVLFEGKDLFTYDNDPQLQARTVLIFAEYYGTTTDEDMQASDELKAFAQDEFAVEALRDAIGGEEY